MNERESLAKLKAAVVRGDVKAAQRLIKGGVDVNARMYEHMGSKWESTLLHEAVISRHVEIVRLLLKYGADVDAKDLNNCTPLHLACRRNDHLIVQTLVDNHASLSSRNDDLRTAFEMAIRWGDLAVVQACISSPKLIGSHGLSVALKNKYVRESPETIHRLIKRGVKLNMAHNMQALCTDVLETAVSVDASPSVVQLLIEHGADPFYKSLSTRKMADQDDRIPGLLGRYILEHLSKKLEALRRLRKDSSTTLTDVIRSCPDEDIATDLLYLQQTENSDNHSQGASQLNTNTEQSKLHTHTEQTKQNTYTSQSKTMLYRPMASLQHKCRVYIRRHLNHINSGKSINEAIKNLPLYQNLVNYILLKDFTSLFMEIQKPFT